MIFWRKSPTQGVWYRKKAAMVLASQQMVG
jgi:hypothetical protein